MASSLTGGNSTQSENLRDSNGIVSVAYHCIGSVGIVGNTLVIVVIMNFRSMRSKNVNVLVLNQSFIDILASVLIVAQTHIDTNRYLDGVGGDIVCRLWQNSVPLWTLLTSSTFNILTITLERYAAVVHPLRYRNISSREKRRITAIAIASVWLVSFAFNCAITSTTSAVRDHSCISMAFYRTEGWKKTAGLVAFVFEFLLPIGICVVCYARIIQKLRPKKVAPQAATVSNVGVLNNQTKARMIRNVHNTFGIVLICSIVCNIGNHSLFLAFNFGYPLDFTGAVYNVSVICTFANCCINPFVYIFKYQMFQQGMKKLFCRARENLSSHSTHSDFRHNTAPDTVHM